jgi:hypothetical protein
MWVAGTDALEFLLLQPGKQFHESFDITMEFFCHVLTFPLLEIRNTDRWVQREMVP